MDAASEVPPVRWIRAAVLKVPAAVPVGAVCHIAVGVFGRYKINGAENKVRTYMHFVLSYRPINIAQENSLCVPVLCVEFQKTVCLRVPVLYASNFKKQSVCACLYYASNFKNSLFVRACIMRRIVENSLFVRACTICAEFQKTVCLCACAMRRISKNSLFVCACTMRRISKKKSVCACLYYASNFKSQFKGQSTRCRYMCMFRVMFRVFQNHIYTVYIRYFWQENHQLYGHIQSMFIVLANPMYVALGFRPCNFELKDIGHACTCCFEPRAILLGFRYESLFVLMEPAQKCKACVLQSIRP